MMFVLSLFASVLAAPASVLAQGPAQTELLRLASRVERFELTPDGRRVVIRNVYQGTGTQDLFSLRADGSGTPTRLNQQPIGRVHDFLVSPTGSTVAYLADRDVLEKFQLFVVPVDGSAPPLELNGPLIPGGLVASIQFSPDGARIVYLAMQDAQSFDLYSVPTDGSAPPVRLNDPLAVGESVTFNAVEITPDSSKVVYFAPIAVPPFRGLFVAPLDGSTAPLLIGGADPTYTSGFPDVPDSLQLGGGSDVAVFHTFESSGSTDDGLYSATFDGSSAPLRLDLQNHVQGFRLSADGAHVVYRDGAVSPDLPRLYSVPSSGDFPIELSRTDPFTQYVKDGFEFTPDGARVLYVADQRTTYRFELFSVPTEGGDSRRLNAALVQGGSVRGFRVDPTGARAVYLVTSYPPGALPRTELFSVPVDGGGAVRISAPMTSGGNVVQTSIGVAGTKPVVAFHPRGGELLYLADQDTDEVFELYRVPLDGHAPAVKVNGALIPAGDVQADFRYGPDRQLFFRADATTDNDFELFTTRSRARRAR